MKIQIHRLISISISLFFLFSHVSIFTQNSRQKVPKFDILITDGKVIDGTGNPWFYADIGIKDKKIVAVGKFPTAQAKQIIRAKGKIVCPGFIDIHSHGIDHSARFQARGLLDQDSAYRAAPNMIAQGVTTLVVNHDGRSPWPIGEKIESLKNLGIGPNAILLIGHGQIRSMVMKEDYQRPATKAEILQMQALVEQGMNEGAYGMSAAHEYVPGRWSTTEELIALAEKIVPWSGIYIVHERSSGTTPMWWWPSQDPVGAPTMLDAVTETIEIAERTGVTAVQTHLKARGANFWGSSKAIIQLIKRARNRGVNIWGDAYTYNTTGSDGNTILIPRWVFRKARETATANGTLNYAHTLKRLLQFPDTASMIRKDIHHEIIRRGDAENIMVLRHRDSALIGRTLQEIADDWGLNPIDLAIKFQLEGSPTRPGGAQLRGFSLSELDVEAFHAEPWVITASDAGITLPGFRLVHPRFYGTFPRKIRRYALERKIVSVEDAIRSMTSLPAQVLGLRDRGLIREGQWADIVLFDLDKIQDKATALKPHQYPEGIDWVLVNGQTVVKEGKITMSLPGVVITPHDRP